VQVPEDTEIDELTRTVTPESILQEIDRKRPERQKE
jgi:hypothetical protein